MPLKDSSTNSRQGYAALKNDSTLSQGKFPPLENVSLNMPLDMSTKNDEQKTADQEKDTSILDLLEPKTRTPKFKKFETQVKYNIEQLGAFIALLAPGIGAPIVEQSELQANNITSYAEVNSKFYNAVQNLIEATPLVTMLAGFAGLGGAILSNYGMNPVENVVRTRLKKQMEKQEQNGKANLHSVPVRI